MNKQELIILTSQISKREIRLGRVSEDEIVNWRKYVIELIKRDTPMTEVIRQYDEDKSKDWNSLYESEKEAIIGSYKTIEEQEP